MTSIFPIAYGMSKFVSGVLGAKLPPSKLLAFGLMATALVNIGFGYGASLTWFCIFWGLNGILQVPRPASPSACAMHLPHTSISSEATALPSFACCLLLTKCRA